MKTQRTTLPFVATLVAALALVACQRRDETTASTESTTASTEQRSSSTTTPPGGTESTATPGTSTPGTTAGTTAPQGDTARTGSAVEDAAVTATINAELAKDPKLSALKIDVDTTNGRVMLKGKAPDAESRDRATQIATAVRGVTSVDNQLQLGG